LIWLPTYTWEKRMKADLVPIEPFQRILIEKLAEAKKTDENAGWESFEPLLGVSGRLIWQIATPGRQEHIKFTLADRIVVRLLGTQAWYDDPELSAIYQGVDLHWIDWASPLTKEIRADQDQLILDLMAEGKNCATVAEEIRCSLHRVNEASKEYREERRKTREREKNGRVAA
jgi:hypothetical protein